MKTIVYLEIFKQKVCKLYDLKILCIISETVFEIFLSLLDLQYLVIRDKKKVWFEITKKKIRIKYGKPSIESKFSSIDFTVVST